MLTYAVVEASPLAARDLISAGWFVLDVRDDVDWAGGHIEGSTHMLLDEVVMGVGSRVVEPVLVVSAIGGKSWRVAAYLALQGIEVANLVGGMVEWERAGLPVQR